MFFCFLLLKTVIYGGKIRTKGRSGNQLGSYEALGYAVNVAMYGYFLMERQVTGIRLKRIMQCECLLYFMFAFICICYADNDVVTQVTY